uniref:Uncharacterized protein n=1 Tax=Cacopsylla melanoneura TaxID=428564 RepID=A0A8D8SSH3_9HEMI
MSYQEKNFLGDLGSSSYLNYGQEVLDVLNISQLLTSNSLNSNKLESYLPFFPFSDVLNISQLLSSNSLNSNKLESYLPFFPFSDVLNISQLLSSNSLNS